MMARRGRLGAGEKGAKPRGIKCLGCNELSSLNAKGGPGRLQGLPVKTGKRNEEYRAAFLGEMRESGREQQGRRAYAAPFPAWRPVLFGACLELLLCADASTTARY